MQVKLTPKLNMCHPLILCTFPGMGAHSMYHYCQDKVSSRMIDPLEYDDQAECVDHIFELYHNSTVDVIFVPMNKIDYDKLSDRALPHYIIIPKDNMKSAMMDRYARSNDPKAMDYMNEHYEELIDIALKEDTKSALSLATTIRVVDITLDLINNMASTAGLVSILSESYNLNEYV